jgi:DNA-binding NtrC family response regulator
MEDLKILVVDDEAANLRKLQRTFVGRYPVLAAGSGREALELIQRHDGIAVIIADQRMPDMTGVDLLRQTLPVLPDAVRIILTGYTDVDVLMEAINSCKVYRYVVKPWDPPDLLMTVQRGLEAYRLSLENARFRKELIRRERLARELETCTISTLKARPAASGSPSATSPANPFRRPCSGRSSAGTCARCLPNRSPRAKSSAAPTRGSLRATARETT